MTKRGDAKLLQVLVRQARENRLVYVVLAENGLILSEAKGPQPDHDVHEGENSGLPHIIVLLGEGVQDSLATLRRNLRRYSSSQRALVPSTACAAWYMVSALNRAAEQKIDEEGE